MRKPEEPKPPEFEDFRDDEGPLYITGPQEMAKESMLHTEFFQQGLEHLTKKLAADAKRQVERN